MAKRVALAALALGVGGAAVGGFGAAIGRDLWRSTKKGAGLLLVVAVLACAVVLPLIGGRNLTRGYPGRAGRGIFSGTAFIVLGAAIALVVITYARTATSTASRLQFLPGDYLIAAGLAAGAAVIGMGWGALQRPTRFRQYALFQQNQAFLDHIGLVETGEEEITHYDADGSPLRLIERTDDSLVFMAVGKRNKRAYIGLGAEGEMVGYTGVIPLDQPRTYKFMADTFDAVRTL